MATKRISSIHQQNCDWLDQLCFVQEELWRYEDELTHLTITRNVDTDHELVVLARKEFARLMQCIDQLRYEIQQTEHYLAGQAKKGQHLEISRDSLKDDINEFLETYHAFKQKLRLFLSSLLHAESV
jgi:uncharacterized protein YdcH (DUF465 family)